MPSYEKSQESSSHSTSSPEDIPSFQAQEFKGFLKSLENRVVLESFLVFLAHMPRLKTKEQRQTLSCGNEEDAGTHNHHDALLEILLIVRNVLIINTN